MPQLSTRMAAWLRTEELDGCLTYLIIWVDIWMTEHYSFLSLSRLLPLYPSLYKVCLSACLPVFSVCLFVCLSPIQVLTMAELLHLWSYENWCFQLGIAVAVYFWAETRFTCGLPPYWILCHNQLILACGPGENECRLA